jgi:outer membrane immunogenic protein
MHKTLSAAVLAAFLVPGGGASAADVYSPGSLKDAPAYVAAPTWNGFYLGINGGGGWTADNNRHQTYSETSGPGDTEFVAGYNSPNASGAFGGGQIGYNWQRGYYVFGIEADIQGAGINGKNRGSSCILNVDEGGGCEEATPFRATSNLDWFGTVRGRLGLAIDRTFVYSTAGFAFGNVKNSISFADRDFTGPSKTETLTGYVLGSGVEYAISPTWSVKGEYQYINLGSQTLHQAETDEVGSDDFAHSNKIFNSFHTVRIGLNYHIGGCCDAPLK